MSAGSPVTRSAAEAIRRERDRVASEVTEEFLRRHPDWVDRYGERARIRGIEDARFHVDFLAGAVAAGGPEPFAAYARWAARVLAARKIPPVFLAENLRQVGDALSAGLEGAVADLVRRTAEAGVAAASEALTGPEDGDPSAEGNLGLARDVFTQAALAGDRVAAANVAREAVLAGHPVVDVYVDVLERSQVEVGRLWESNRITVGVEHLATAVTQYVLAQMFPLLERSAIRRGRAIVTGIEGESHQLGGHMVADLLESEGWDVMFLGTNSPTEDVLRLVAEHRPRFVGISAATLINLPKVVTLIARLRAGAGQAPKVIVGGALFRTMPALWQEVGADAFASDLREVAALARSIAGAPEGPESPASL